MQSEKYLIQLMEASQPNINERSGLENIEELPNFCQSVIKDIFKTWNDSGVTLEMLKNQDEAVLRPNRTYKSKIN